MPAIDSPAVPPTDAPDVDALCDQEVCPVCEQPAEVRTSVLFGKGNSGMCKDCMFVWYSDGLTDPDDIKKASLERQRVRLAGPGGGQNR